LVALSDESCFDDPKLVRLHVQSFAHALMLGANISVLGLPSRTTIPQQT
jgi:hypothetical protein